MALRNAFADLATAPKQDEQTTELTSISTGVGDPVDAAATTDTGTFAIIPFIKRGMQNWTTLLARIPTLVGGRVPVDGSGVTQPVSGPLTDTQLRATAVPVSGTVAISNSSIEIANDVGNPVPVSGPLTDTQLRASAVPISTNVQLGGGIVTGTTTRVTMATDGPGVANLASIAGLSIPAHDYILCTYTGNNITSIVYRTGGSGGTIVGTLTLAYNVNNQLISVTRS